MTSWGLLFNLGIGLSLANVVNLFSDPREQTWKNYLKDINLIYLKLAINDICSNFKSQNNSQLSGCCHINEAFLLS